MKTAILRAIADQELEIGDRLPGRTEMGIRLSCAGDTPKKINKFYRILNQIAPLKPGLGYEGGQAVRVIAETNPRKIKEA